MRVQTKSLSGSKARCLHMTTFPCEECFFSQSLEGADTLRRFLTGKLLTHSLEILAKEKAIVLETSENATERPKTKVVKTSNFWEPGEQRNGWSGWLLTLFLHSSSYICILAFPRAIPAECLFSVVASWWRFRRLLQEILYCHMCSRSLRKMRWPSALKAGKT